MANALHLALECKHSLRMSPSCLQSAKLSKQSTCQSSRSNTAAVHVQICLLLTRRCHVVDTVGVNTQTRTCGSKPSALTEKSLKPTLPVEVTPTKRTWQRK
jgi:hypothetical protein